MSEIDLASEAGFARSSSVRLLPLVGLVCLGGCQVIVGLGDRSEAEPARSAADSGTNGTNGGSNGTNGGSNGTNGGSNGTNGGNVSSGGSGAGAAAGATNGPGPGGSAGQGGSRASGGASGGIAAGAAGKASAGGSAGAANGSAGAGIAGQSGSGNVTDGSVPRNPALLQDCSGTNPILCAIPVADGNYTVTVELGDPTVNSRSRVQAETYRIFVPELAVAGGAYSLQTFTTNVRAEKHDGYSAVGGVLNLMIDGSAPRLHGLGVAPEPSAISIFVVGESTVCDWDPQAATAESSIERGWAQEFSQYLKPGVAVLNYADAGETASTCYVKFWPGPDALKAGDYVFIQFGHNDQKVVTDTVNFQTNLLKYITDARAKNATPVLISPVARLTATIANPGFANLDTEVLELAANEHVAFIDLTKLSITAYSQQANVSSWFATSTSITNFSETGANEIAKLVANTIKTGPLPLKNYVK